MAVNVENGKRRFIFRNHLENVGNYYMFFRQTGLLFLGVSS